jgi:Na+/H+-dicarboxylate symporter
MGATINMDGSAIGYPCAVAFLAHTAKLVIIYNDLFHNFLHLD